MFNQDSGKGCGPMVPHTLPPLRKESLLPEYLGEGQGMILHRNIRLALFHPFFYADYKCEVVWVSLAHPVDGQLSQRPLSFFNQIK